MPRVPEESLWLAAVWGTVGRLSAMTVSVLLVYRKPFCLPLAQPLRALGQCSLDRPLQGKSRGDSF